MLIAVTPNVLQLCQFFAEQNASQDIAPSLSEVQMQQLLQKGAELDLRVTILPDNAGLLLVGNSDSEEEYWGEFSFYELGRIANGMQTKMAVSRRGAGC